MSQYTEDQLSLDGEDELEEESTSDCPEVIARRKRNTLIALIGAVIISLSIVISALVAGPNLRAGADQLQAANDWTLVHISDGTQEVMEYHSYSKIWQVIRNELTVEDTQTIMNNSGYKGVSCGPTFSEVTAKSHYLCTATSVAGFGRVNVRLYVDDNEPNAPGGYQVHLVVSKFRESQ